jgi:anti-sigma factor RsiW
MSRRAGHPSKAQIEAAVFGRLGAEEAARLRAHAADCPICGPRLAREEDTRRRLEVLKQDQPRVDVVQQVLERIEIDAHDQPAS